jgi:hypothetical protein
MSYRKLSAYLLAIHAPVALSFQPLVTDDSGTQGAGGNQIEIALDRQEFDSTGDTTRTRTLPLVYTRGITDTLDGYVEVSHVRVRSTIAASDTEGRGNPAVGLKWRFYDDTARKFSVAFKSEMQFGVSTDAESRGLGSGRTGYSGLIIVTQGTGFGAVHVNYGFTRASYALEANRNANRRGLHSLSGASVFEVVAGWNLAIDLGVTTNPDRTQRAQMGYAEFGVIWSPRNDLDVALGMIRHIGDGEPRSTVLTAGVTWRFR